MENVGALNRRANAPQARRTALAVAKKAFQKAARAMSCSVERPNPVEAATSRLKDLVLNERNYLLMRDYIVFEANPDRLDVVEAVMNLSAPPGSQPFSFSAEVRDIDAYFEKYGISYEDEAVRQPREWAKSAIENYIRSVKEENEQHFGEIKKYRRRLRVDRAVRIAGGFAMMFGGFPQMGPAYTYNPDMEALRRLFFKRNKTVEKAVAGFFKFIKENTKYKIGFALPLVLLLSAIKPTHRILDAVPTIPQTVEQMMQDRKDSTLTLRKGFRFWIGKEKYEIVLYEGKVKWTFQDPTKDPRFWKYGAEKYEQMRHFPLTGDEIREQE